MKDRRGHQTTCSDLQYAGTTASAKYGAKQRLRTCIFYK